jgi:hypothetical protein
MIDEEKFKFAQWTLARSLNWIGAADSKVGSIIAVDTAMLGGLATIYGTARTKSEMAVILAVIAALLLTVALACIAGVVKPRLSGPPKSLIFFGKIAALPIADYQDQFRRATRDELFADLSDQIHRNAEIAKHKHEFVVSAILVSILSVPFWTLAVCFLAKGLG